ADELTILADAQSIRSDLSHCRTKLLGEAKSIGADLKGLPNSSQNRSLLATFKSDEKRCLNTLKADVSALVKAGASGARAALADGIRVFLDPTNAKARSRLANDLARLRQAGTGPLNKLLSDLASCQATVTGDLKA